MRALVWQELFWPYIGGVEILSAKLLVALSQRGHEIVVVTRQDDADLPSEGQYEGIPIYRYPFVEAYGSKNLDQYSAIRSKIIKLKRSFAPDVVHLNCLGVSALLYLVTANTQAAPLLLTLHNPMRSDSVGRSGNCDGIFHKTLRSASWVCCVSGAVLSNARELVSDITPKSSIIYNGFEMPVAALRPLPYDPPEFLYLGRLIRHKRVDLLLSSFVPVIACFPRARLTIAGDGPERIELENQCAELGLTRSVDFLGTVAPAEIGELLNTATAVVIPSRNEGLPSVAIEAALMCRPVIATKVGGVPEIVLHEKTGLLVPANGQQRMTDAMLFLLTHPDTAAAFGKAACDRAKELFSFRRYVDAYDDLYRKLASKEIASFASA
jgi:glycogen(starch) synthase